VAGPRSALWLPYNDIGLIITDEEHDSSYKQKDPAPRFHARDAAIYMARLHDAGVILGSATPAVETLYNVQQGKYAYAALKDRYQGV
jgi:primosomal protein N' (replication factor Y)